MQRISITILVRGVLNKPGKPIDFNKNSGFKGEDGEDIQPQ